MLELNKVYCIDVMDGLKQLSDESIDLILTSPPYWGLRNYGEKANRIWGKDKNCQHEFVEEKVEHCESTIQGETSILSSLKGISRFSYQHGFCSKCNAWSGQLGLEPTFQMYLDHLFEIFMECKRVLKRSGSMWINIGDTFSGSQGVSTAKTINYKEAMTKSFVQSKTILPNKCLIGIPWRLALKLVDEGRWVLRNNVIWSKPNAMPESVRDRLTNVYEDVFFFVRDDAKSDWYLLGNKPNPEKNPERYAKWEKAKEWWAKSEIKHESEIPIEHKSSCMNLDYYFNLDAIREPHALVSLERAQRAVNLGVMQVEGKYASKERTFIGSPQEAPRWFREQFKEDRGYKGKFDGMESVEQYGSPRARTQRDKYSNSQSRTSAGLHEDRWDEYLHIKGKNPGDVFTINTEPLMEAHFAAFPSELCKRIIKACCHINSVVFDPFCGSGRALVTVKYLNRQFIGFDINSDYVEIAKKLLSKEPEKLSKFFDLGVEMIG